MKGFSKLFTLSCLAGLSIGSAGCNLPSRGAGDAFLFYDSRTEIGVGHTNDGDKADATSEISVSFPALEKFLNSLSDAPTSEPDSDDVPGS